ncbi:MAG: RNA polymerase subunit sigma [Planctomycetaceae bacterium]|nr:RNA polymerase subunit sigma [Planctomycetaceae bacterium]
MNADDQELIDACLAGRTEAFGTLVVRYQDRLYNTLVGVLGSSDDARDAVQDSFVHAFRKLETFRGKSAFYSWLFRIAINTAISHKRKNRRTSTSIDSTKELTGLEPHDPRHDTPPSHALETLERQQTVQTALAQLAEEYRTVLILKEMEGLKYEEIAEIVGCPIGTIRSRIHRARAELRERLRILLKEEQ